MQLPSILDRAEFASLSLVQVGKEWQASLEVTRGSFRIRMGATPSEALEALFGMEAPSLCPAALPPLPY